MKTKMLLVSMALFASLAAPAAEESARKARITLNLSERGPEVSPLLYGIFFEEINCAGDGGLYAELVRNRSFEESATPAFWSLAGQTNEATAVLENKGAESGHNKRALKFTFEASQDPKPSLLNDGYWGMAVRKGATYSLRVIGRGLNGFKGPIVAALESRNGEVYGKAKLSGLGDEWKPLEVRIESSATDPQARLRFSLEKPGGVMLDFVSLFPRKTWNERTNGLRPDLAEKLEGLKPAFVRFPGGCWVEGDTMALAYRWKDTIGPLHERRTHYNIWQYYSTHGLGYHEYLQMCEDLKAEPLFVVNCGMSHREVVPMAELGPWVQDALDAIEYANGPVTSKWGALRAKNGHSVPFGLKYIEIGNENGGPAYNERYAAFYKAIKDKYPEVVTIANLWGGVPKDSPIEIIDEHYYSNPGFFIQNANRYDTYDRKGPKIYVGEYAVTQNSGQGNWRGALAEAVFMMGMERNSDVVIMSSYAPLFANVNYKRWNPDLINFDSSRVYGIPSYYVQQLFAVNRPDVIVPVQVEAQEVKVKPPTGGIGLGTWNTQAEYKDVKVVRGDEVLYASPSGESMDGWKVIGGDWQVREGAIQQSARGDDRRLTRGNPNWSDYTLSLKARKTGGAEGFLIMFNVRDDQNWFWWNIGGWNNTRHAIEHSMDGGKSQVGRDAQGRVETGRWYDVRVELAGDVVRCFLDDKLVHEEKLGGRLQPLHAVAGVTKGGETILKVANVSDSAFETDVEFTGGEPSGKASVTVMTSNSDIDENSLEAPEKVIPWQNVVEMSGATMRHSFPARSLTVFKFGTKPGK